MFLILEAYILLVVAQWAKAPGSHGFTHVACPIPTITSGYCTIKTKNVLRSTKKKEKNYNLRVLPIRLQFTRLYFIRILKIKEY
jgi:hypothetical protein